MLSEVRSKGSEPPGEHYYEVFGRRRRVPVVDQEAPTLVPNEKSEKGATTGPVVTETRPAAVLPKKQMMWLALGRWRSSGLWWRWRSVHFIRRRCRRGRWS